MIINTLDMGNNCCQQDGAHAQYQNNSSEDHTNTLVIATLNYGSILNNPFQFVIGRNEKQYEQISQIFRSLMPLYLGVIDESKFKWDFGVDKESSLTRYSPVFDRLSGVLADRLMTQAEFEAKWEQVFQKGIKKEDLKVTRQQHESVKCFDIILYHTMLRYCYQGLKDIDDAQYRDYHDYIVLTRPFYQPSFLSHSKKLEKFMSKLPILNPDIFFLQQYSTDVYDYFVSSQEWHIALDETKDTMIAAKKGSLGSVLQSSQILNKQSDKQIAEKLNPRNRSCFLFIGEYILINSHLSSKKEKSSIEVKLLAEGLNSLSQRFPEKTIIAGGDLNTFLDSSALHPNFSMFPKKQSQYTTVKKRTFAQGQFHKAGKLIEESKDKIMTTKPIKSAKIVSIIGQPVALKVMLPSTFHPFDHFLCQVHLPK